MEHLRSKRFKSSPCFTQNFCNPSTMVSRVWVKNINNELRAITLTKSHGTTLESTCIKWSLSCWTFYALHFISNLLRFQDFSQKHSKKVKQGPITFIKSSGIASIKGMKCYPCHAEHFNYIFSSHLLVFEILHIFPNVKISGWWRTSWLAGGVIGYNYERVPSKDHST